MSTRSTTALGNTPHASDETSQRGLLVVNADDWGKDVQTTDRIFECILRGTVSSTSAMVFMADSERAAGIGRERHVDTGLHLNLSESFTGAGNNAKLVEHHDQIRRYLRGNHYAQILYHPGLANSFRYVVQMQLDEYRRLYGVDPEHIDGHHHMHLAANVVYNKLLPEGTVIRRNFSFQSGDKSLFNRTYRGWMDRKVGRRHPMPDYLFNLVPFDVPGRIERIVALAQDAIVELETHPANAHEHQYLNKEMARHLGTVRISPGFELVRRLRSGKRHSAAAV